MSSSYATSAAPWNTTTPGDNHIPRFVTYTSPVSAAPGDGGAVRATTLPLNLIALIISYLDDVGDVARVTRTSRLLYYMTLPQLYANVSLHSYPDIRYVNGRPEGYGSGSPFIMALNGLLTKSHAGMVEHFRAWGQWNELGVEDFAKGRVPDNNMMLNILVRAAVDRMNKLRSFTWELDCKPLKTLYQGLGAHHSLTSLTLKFPKSRLPRPSVMIPPMANLRAFKALDIDPLCYPDDFSLLLLESKKLEDLRLHFSPRMRQEAESSLSLETYFGRCHAAGYVLPLKHMAIQNFYGPSASEYVRIVDVNTFKSMTTFDMFGGIAGQAINRFYDDTWRDLPKDVDPRFKRTRCNEPAEQHVTLLEMWTGLESFYMVNSRASKLHEMASPQPVTPAESPPDQGMLGKQYVYALTRHHGSTLKHLLLSDQWMLDEEDVKEIVQRCPSLEQLAFASHMPYPSLFHLLDPLLPTLRALRFISTETARPSDVDSAGDELKWHLETTRASALQYIGLANGIFKVTSDCQEESDSGRIHLKEVQLDDVKHVEIWGLDNTDISLDPVGRFSR